MEFSNDIPPPSYQGKAKSDYRVFNVNYKWRKSQGLITEPGAEHPTYIIDCSNWKMRYRFRRGPSVSGLPVSDDTKISDQQLEGNETDVVGDGSTQAFRIDCPLHINGRALTLSAASKLQTKYNYTSYAYATDPNKPAVMQWFGKSMVKWFDFDLTDEAGNKVARYYTNYAGIKRIGTIEMFGPKAHDQLAADEVVVTSVMMAFVMMWRVSNMVPLVGAITSRSGKSYKVSEQEALEEERKNLAAHGGEGSTDFLNPYAENIDNPDPYRKSSEVVR
ncbi:uncharacterized protein AB675_3528 [Cyphellophora attinorum]|uniref:Phospholipid scramblase n=1 Tax=Cyphellophora attinorum TaxID=1664694 RepID=A0A0N0NLU2_9EURO|nr:uncharacterized protein AB675_3528 [Phialophora attinorum]KPI39578.1 hypothetical protein AB675_3528 [Phialophora attinorum]